MSAGKRDQRVRFETPNTAGDGYGGLTGGWTAVGAETMAAIVALSGREQVAAMAAESRTLFRVTIPNRRDLTAAMRLVWLTAGNQVLNIRDLADPGPRAIERALVCELAPELG